MKATARQIRRFRLHAHNLAQMVPMADMIRAAGACGLQNTPPGAWETALHNRLDGCTLAALRDALYRDRVLLQAWSYRGVPVVFPTAQSDVFLTPLMAQVGEEPWIYTRGITGALDHLQMSFDDLLARTKSAVRYLDDHTIHSKEALDRKLAEIIEETLPQGKRALWRAPSMYGSPDRQTVGGAAVSFLLRPCAFDSLVVFGERQGASPTFASLQNWTGCVPDCMEDAGKRLARKFLHCYGPTTMECWMDWLGCSRRKAQRLWDAVANELTPLAVAGKTRYMLSADCDSLLACRADDERIVLLGPHDPYLDLKDRQLILEDAARHKTVWQYVSNPGVVLRGGGIAGVWKVKTRGKRLDATVTLWEKVSPAERQTVQGLVHAYAAFREAEVGAYREGCRRIQFVPIKHTP